MAGKKGGAALFPIGAVARKTGLSTHVLRAWERRYGVVEPKRAEGGTRLYDEADVVRLRLLKRVVDAGHSIGRVANAGTDELLALLREEPGVTRGQTQSALPDGMMEECLEAIEAMDGSRVHACLMRGAVVLGAERFLAELVVPLLHRVGELWRRGTLCPAHEHLFSATVKRVLGWMMEQVSVPGGGPVIVATTPAGQRHEMGSMLTGVVAAEEGWRVEYLGPDLPGEDIARAVSATGARVVALSVIHECTEEELLAEVRELREQVPGEVVIMVGGRAANQHGDALVRAGAVWLPDLGSLRAQLRGLTPTRAEVVG
jgi:MerR family transcriptional regulator, light-induced transcriptional regulator